MLACALALGAVWACAGSGSAIAAKAKPSVAGGKPASLADFGFTVAILQDGKFICSGSVISPARVLTAAHCTTVAAQRLAVVAGRTALGGTGGEVLPVSGYSTHPGSDKPFRSDVAVLALGTPTTAPTIKLASAEEDAATTQLGASMTVAGFGRRNQFGFGKARIGQLYAATLFSRTGCKKYRNRFFPAEMICANGAQFQRVFRLKLMRTACPGDSGGPLIAQTPGGPRQVGVVSFGVSTPFILCGEKGFPGVFSRVSFFQPFLAPYTAAG